jgi:hypothetical protein
MTTDLSPAKLYRREVRSVLELFRNKLPAPSDSEIELEKFLENMYKQLKKQLLQLVIENAPESVIKGEKMGVFILASGLFAFGHLDVAQDILDGIPSGRANIRRLALVLKALLPMPKNIDPLTNPLAVKEWLSIYRHNLEWNANLEKFIFKSN